MTPKEVRYIRRKLGLTQAQLAQWMRVHPISVARWELGTRGMKGPVTKLLEEALSAARGNVEIPVGGLGVGDDDLEGGPAGE